jgi:hypothetical protein
LSDYCPSLALQSAVELARISQELRIAEFTHGLFAMGRSGFND